jgi:hypothetical protein
MDLPMTVAFGQKVAEIGRIAAIPGCRLKFFMAFCAVTGSWGCAGWTDLDEDYNADA